MGFFGTSALVLGTAVAVVVLPDLFKEKLPIVGEGYAAPGWRPVADAFREMLESGMEPGGAFALYHKGELVVEFSGGYADEEARLGWTKDTLSMIFSASKGVAALVMALLVERELISYDKPVAYYWPEFAQNGKEKVTVEQLLSHQAGLCALDEPWNLAEPDNHPEQMGEKLAAQKPIWEPGVKHGYHVVTYGLYVDQLVRRVDPQHRDFSQFFEEEIAERYGLDFYFGLPKEESYRAARIVPASVFSISFLRHHRGWPYFWKLVTNPNSLPGRAAASPPELKSQGILNNPSARTNTNPSMYGFATAMAAGKLMGIVANGGSFEGEKLLSPESIKKLKEPMFTPDPIDAVMQINVTFGRGTTPYLSPADSTLIGHPGAGGQALFADTDNNLGWAYITNHMSMAMGDDPRYMTLINTVYETYNKIQQPG